MKQPFPRPWSRRAVLRAGVALSLAVPAAACSFGRGATTDATTSPTAQPTEGSPSATNTATSTPAQSPTPTPTPTATTPPATQSPAAFEFRPRTVGNGEATLLIVRAIERTGVVRFIGTTVPLRAQGDFLWALLGVPVDATLGARTAQVTLFDAAGKTTRQIDAVTQVVHVERPVDYLEVTEEVGAILTPQAGITEEQLRAKEFAAFDPDVRWDRPFIKPAAGYISTEFGSGRSINGGPIGGFHSGADIANDQGTPIVAAAPGRVAFVETHPIRGISVIIDHGSGVKSGYHHLEAALVTPGTFVSAGTLIARMGTTGFSTGPHLHWEVTVYGVNVDPFTWTTQTFRP